jgi:MFS family permease
MEYILGAGLLTRPTRPDVRGGPPEGVNVTTPPQVIDGRSAAQVGAPPAQARTSLAVAAVGTMLALVAFTTPIATLNAVSADLGADVAGRTWILSSMGIGLGAALLMAGTLADDFGRRRLIVGGLALLAGASAAGALAPTTGALVLARVVQGVGAAAVIASSLGLVAQWHAPGPARAAASGVWGASVGAGIAVGPLLSSYLERVATWRDAFWVVAVASLVGAAWGRWRLVEVRSTSPRGMDLAGTVLFGTSVTTLLAALVEGRQGWARPVVMTLVAVSLASAVAFVVAERRNPAAMLEPALFRSRRFVAATVGALATGIGIIGLLSFMPGFLGLALGLPATAAALLVLAWSATSVATSLLARRIPARVGGRLQLAGGLIGVATGQLLLGGLTSATTLPRLLPGLLVAGAASGVLNAALGREAVASVPADRGGMGSGANNTARYVGSAIGVTVVSVVVANHATVPAPPGLIAGWNVAAVVTALFSLAGAAVILLARER